MGRVVSALLGLLVAVVATGAVGCTRTVAGSPVAAAAVSTRVAGSVTSSGSVTVSGSVTSSSGAPLPTPSGSNPTPTADVDELEPEVLADECLLDAAQLTALLGRPMQAPAESAVQRDDGARSSSCYATPVDDDAGPVAAINVYRVRAGTPAQFVRAAQGRALTGAGAVAAVLDTPAGATLQVAGARLLVTVTVQDREPADAAWRAAARAALARLPR